MLESTATASPMEAAALGSILAQVPVSVRSSQSLPHQRRTATLQNNSGLSNEKQIKAFNFQLDENNTRKKK